MPQQDLANQAVMSFDPLPPVDSINLYERTSRPTVVDDPSSLRLFFRSMLPNFDPNQELPENADQELVYMVLLIYAL